MASGSAYSDSVFLNCPFDPEYQPLFEALVFCVIDCGFVPRCALDAADAGTTRIERICKLVEGCALSIHDLCRVELSDGLPRSNMPFELGLDIGCRRFGRTRARRKKSLILDSQPYRYQKFLSDIAGQDIRAHDDSAEKLITCVRDWLRNTSGRQTIPGPTPIKERFRNFSADLPSLCDEAGLDRSTIDFADYKTLVEGWLSARPNELQAAP